MTKAQDYSSELDDKEYPSAEKPDTETPNDKTWDSN